MNEEKYIEQCVGKRNPFRVPDGYFDQFADQMMKQLPERQPRANTVWLRPVRYAAACLCVLIVSAVVYLSLSERSAVPEQRLAAQQEEPVTPLDEAADYMMLDNHDIYALLASE